VKPIARRRARECAAQALYSWQLSKNDITDIQSYFLSEQDMKEVDINYFGQLLFGVAVDTAALDRLMAPYLSRQIEDLGQIEKAILRLAVFELSQRDDIPYKVVINEAIELAKIFGAEDSHKFVNGVLDKIAPIIRKRKQLNTNQVIPTLQVTAKQPETNERMPNGISSYYGKAAINRIGT